MWWKGRRSFIHQEQIWNIVRILTFSSSGPEERIDIPDESNKKRLLCCLVRYKRATLFSSRTFLLWGKPQLLSVTTISGTEWCSMAHNTSGGRVRLWMRLCFWRGFRITKYIPVRLTTRTQKYIAPPPLSRSNISIVRGRIVGNVPKQVPQWHSYLAFSSSQLL